MKKALIVTRVSGFVPQFEMNHVRILQQMGFEVHYAANFDTIVYGNDNSRLEGTGIVCHHIDFCRSPFSSRVLSSYRSLKDLMEREQFELIHCHMPMSGVVTRLAAHAWEKKSKRKVPVIYTAHGFHFYTGAPLKNWIYYLPERFLARYTDRLITMNEEDYGRATTFAVRGKAEKIPGVGIRLDVDTLPSDEVQRAKIRKETREELGLREEEYVLLSVGELTTRKNHMEILRVLADYPQLKVRYVICGSGPLEDELKSYVQAQGLQEKVIFTGYCTNINDVMVAADCFVFPSYQEGLPMAMMEAMRAGLPVIARKIRGNVDLIQEGEGGILLEQPTSKSYFEAISMLMGEKELAMKMGEWNQQQIKNFSIEKVTNKMEEIYKDVWEESKA